MRKMMVAMRPAPQTTPRRYARKAIPEMDRRPERWKSAGTVDLTSSLLLSPSSSSPSLLFLTGRRLAKHAETSCCGRIGSGLFGSQVPRSAGRLSGQEMSVVLYRDMMEEEDSR